MQRVMEWLLQQDCLFWEEIRLSREDFVNFLGIPPTSRATRATRSVELMREVLLLHSKQHFAGQLMVLAGLERELARSKDSTHRDHVVHALYTYVIGWALYRKWLKQRPADEPEAFPLQWGLAAILHDVGYLLVADRDKSATRFLEAIQAVGAAEPNGPPCETELRLRDLVCLGELGNGVDLLSDVVHGWGLGQIDVGSIWESELENHELHGLWSAIALLYMAARLYSRREWARDGFRQKIVPAAAAILLHDMQATAFADLQLRPEITTLAYMLRLADTLQDWERPRGSKQCWYRPDCYQLEIVGRELTWRVDIRSRVKDILDDLKPLSMDGLRVIGP